MTAAQQRATALVVALWSSGMTGAFYVTLKRKGGEKNTETKWWAGKKKNYTDIKTTSITVDLIYWDTADKPWNKFPVYAIYRQSGADCGIIQALDEKQTSTGMVKKYLQLPVVVLDEKSRRRRADVSLNKNRSLNWDRRKVVEKPDTEDAEGKTGFCWVDCVTLPLLSTFTSVW